MRTTKWASASTAGEALILQFLCEPSPSLHKTASSEALDNVFLRSKGIQSPSPSGQRELESQKRPESSFATFWKHN